MTDTSEVTRLFFIFFSSLLKHYRFTCVRYDTFTFFHSTHTKMKQYLYTIEDEIEITTSVITTKRHAFRFDTEERMGTFFWLDHDRELYVYATPYFEDCEGLAVAVMSSSDEYVAFDVAFDHESDDYVDTMSQILQLVDDCLEVGEYFDETVFMQVFSESESDLQIDNLNAI